jgi:hypothetical protein
MKLFWGAIRWLEISISNGTFSKMYKVKPLRHSLTVIHFRGSPVIIISSPADAEQPL